MENEVKNLRETIYLFKFLFPDNSFKKPEKPTQKFTQSSKAQNLKLLSSLFKNNTNNYESLFIDISKDSGLFQKASEEDESNKSNQNASSNNNCLQENFKDEQDVSKIKKPKIPNLPLTLGNNQAESSNKNNKIKIPNLKLTMKGSYTGLQENNDLEENNEENLIVGEYQKEVLQQIDFEFPKKSYRKDKESSFDERNSENSIKRAQIKNLELSFIIFPKKSSLLQKIFLFLDNIRMKISDDNFMNINYWDIANEEKEGFNFDIRDTTRKFIKMEHFSSICSEIIEVKCFIYLYLCNFF